MIRDICVFPTKKGLLTDDTSELLFPHLNTFMMNLIALKLVSVKHHDFFHLIHLVSVINFSVKQNKTTGLQLNVSIK